MRAVKMSKLSALQGPWLPPVKLSTAETALSKQQPRPGPYCCTVLPLSGWEGMKQVVDRKGPSTHIGWNYQVRTVDCNT